ncbi:MAG: PTS sugar transporter subunit IIA [Candidatus Cloacimonetes bacterium]|nr:PTS sugar transporter subunit IIA [Candidatus Cloacimonadota bacterium]
MLEKYTNHDLVLLNPQIDNKEALFKVMTDHLHNKGYIENRHRFYRALVAREQAANTAIFPHIAIPHAGCKSVGRLFLLIVVSKKGINYEHPTYDPVNIAFLFGCDNQHNKEYLRLLAKSARLLKNPTFSEKLINANNIDEVLSTIREYDQDIDQEETHDNLLLVITLFKKHKLPDLLTSMLDVGIHNAEVITSSSMSRRIAYHIPVFAGLSIQSKKKSLESVVVMANITDKKTPQHLTSILKEHELDFSQAGVGFMQVFHSSIIIGNIDEFS